MTRKFELIQTHRADEPVRYTLADLTTRLNYRFEGLKASNPRGYLDEFDSRFGLFCCDIAQELGAQLEILPEGNDEVYVFNWSGVARGNLKPIEAAA